VNDFGLLKSDRLVEPLFRAGDFSSLGRSMAEIPLSIILIWKEEANI
jgi:hypothetical protein